MPNFIQYKNCQVHFTQQGKGSAVVLLHGFLENLNIWNDISAILSQKYRVVCIDLLGHGKTDNLGYVHTMDQQAQMVKTVLNKLRLRKVIIIGHSMGGYVAMAFAKLFPQNIKGICLLNSTFLSDNPNKVSDRNKTIEIVKKNPEIIIKIAIPGLFADKNKVVFKREMQHILKEALKTSKQGIVAALEGMKIREDLSDLLEDNTFKTLVFIGKEDLAIKTIPLKKKLQTLPDVQVVYLEGGHMGFIENKDIVLAELSRFCRLCFKT
ncbi:MAG: alpha/beta fold hydrolase [Flavobacteriaceae bacterium]|nr:alpha/beta fold hydrolase [Flavobacteriaceae bacterium]